MSVMPPEAEVNSEQLAGLRPAIAGWWHRPRRDSSSETGAPNHARRTQRLRMDRHRTDAAEQTAWVRRVNDRRVLSGIFWVLRSGAPWRDLPETYGPRTTCYNRFVRWQRAGLWDRVMDALVRWS